MAQHAESSRDESADLAPSRASDASVSDPGDAIDLQQNTALVAALRLGLAMRAKQRKYFKSRAHADLLASLAAEQAFDVAALAALGRTEP